MEHGETHQDETHPQEGTPIASGLPQIKGKQGDERRSFEEGYMKFLMGNINISIEFSVFVAKKKKFLFHILCYWQLFRAHGNLASPADGCGHFSDMERR